MFRSIDIYDEAYDAAYGKGLYLKDEIEDMLYQSNLYSFFDDQDLEKYKKDLENLKVDAFKSFRRPKDLGRIKFQIRQLEEKMAKISRKKNQYDHITCEGYATFAQWNWIIENSTFFSDTGKKFDWTKITVTDLMSYYESNAISSSDFRRIARSDQWRPIWLLGKKAGNLFDRPASLLTRDQVTLCSYSMMYDSVYESTESPPEKVIEDDDCLDGWFIDQKKKQERAKKQQEADSIISSNPKIANASEVFLVAGSKEEIEHIESLNSFQSRMIKDTRMAQLRSKGEIKSDLEFADVQREQIMEQNRTIISKMQGN